MNPNISPPPPDEVARLLTLHADRFPEKFTIGPLPGARGVDVYLPVILGNPRSGSTAFADAIGAALSLRPQGDPIGTDLVHDCLIYPTHDAWDGMRARWAAIDTRVSRALAFKLGSNAEVLVAPTPVKNKEDGTETPAIPPDGLTVPPSGVWRWLKPQSAEAPIAIAISPPSDVAWATFVVAAKTPDTDLVVLAQDLAKVCVSSCTMPIADVFARWPGTAIALMSVVAELAGVDAEVKLGFW